MAVIVLRTNCRMKPPRVLESHLVWGRTTGPTIDKSLFVQVFYARFVLTFV